MSDTTKHEDGCDCDSVQVVCENDCSDGFDVYMTPVSLILTCKGCETEYEVSSGRTAMDPSIS